MIEGNPKTLPHNLQAEQAVLACLMLDYVGCNEGIDRLKKNDFYSPAHQEIFSAMQKVLKDNKKTIDFVTVVEALSNSKKLESVGGLEYLNKINDSVPSVASFRQYYDIVKKHATLRAINKAGKEIVETSTASDDEQETLGYAEKLLFDIATQNEKKELTPIGQELPAVIDRLDTLRKDPNSIYGVKTDFYGIDNLTNGFHGGELIILAARPGVGKTSLGLNMIMNAAIKSGKKCAVFSLEMSKAQLTLRAVCSLAMVSSYHAGRGELDNSQWARMVNATDVLSSADIYIDDNSQITTFEIKRKCMRLKREHGLDFVMIDYLGLMGAPSGDTGNNKFANRQEIVAANSRAMKIMAKELDIPVLLLAQLNRNVETQKTKGGDVRPQLHDLRESGAIEQDADIVMFIHMEKPSEQSTDDEIETDTNDAQEAEILIRKHRNGPCGTVKVLWRKEYTTFANTSGGQQAQDARDGGTKPQKKSPVQKAFADKE